MERMVLALMADFCLRTFAFAFFHWEYSYLG